MVYNNKAKRLDMPIQRFMEKTYEFAEQEQCKRIEISKFVNKFAFEYMKAETQDTKTAIYLSEIVAEQVKKSFMTLFNCLINVTPIKKSKGQVKLKKIELMWKTREEKESEIYKNQNVYVLAEGYTESIDIAEMVIRALERKDATYKDFEVIGATMLGATESYTSNTFVQQISFNFMTKSL
jgi:hypothetical protein